MIIDKIEKTTLLIKRFFLKFSKIDFSNIKKFIHFESIKFEKFIIHEIQRAINDVFNNKISKNDEIENRAIALLVEITNLLNIFKQFFQTNFDHEYCFQHFKRSITICLRKFEKNDYNIFKNYRSIVLLFIINKTLKSILINRLA